MKENNTSTREPGWYTVRTSKGWMRAFYSNGWNIDLPVLEVKENNVPGLGNPDDAQLRRTACTPESHIEQKAKSLIDTFLNSDTQFYQIEGFNGYMHPYMARECAEILATAVYRELDALGITSIFWREVRKAIINYDIDSLNQGEDEAQRIVETEAQPENQVPTTKYPIGGYAPGNYINTCVTCSEQFVGDKLAMQCEPCAIETTTKIPAPTTQQDKPVLSGEVSEAIRELKNLDRMLEQERYNSWSYARLAISRALKVLSSLPAPVNNIQQYER